jgi:RimJ/RimL family protein N-acetyltransferase
MGLDAVTCWILGGNHRSTRLAQACRMTQWGLLPKLARYGDETFDVQIWGVRFDDALWVAYMDAMQERLARRKGREDVETPAVGLLV